MIFPTNYKCLNKNTFSKGLFSIVPIRFQDRMDIMKWRNEQIYHLRQPEPLTEERQNNYFENVVVKLFKQKQPNQILFSYFQEDKCIGYGGLVHINWIDKNAEISFIINTELEKDEFEYHWLIYLDLIEKVAFQELNFHKLFTFAFDLRPHLYVAVEKAGFCKEAILKEHCFWENKFIDAVIHSKINYQISIRKALDSDVTTYFRWVNDKTVRDNAINKSKIMFDDHIKWFQSKLKSSNSLLFYFEINHNPLGQVRFDIVENKALIDYSIDEKYRNQGLGKAILKQSITNLKQEKREWATITLLAKVKSGNKASASVFIKCGFRKVFDEKISKELYYCFEL
ncbi:MAG: GNAT family N-acetyltransferase [Saprospiraceae bacterium]